MIFTFTGRVISCSGLGGWEFVMGAEHGARGTGHRAQGTGLRAQGTEHGAQSTGRRAGRRHGTKGQYQ